MKIRSVDQTSNVVEINVIPLLDVVFAILAFFVLIAAGLSPIQRIGVDLPQSNSQSGEVTKLPTEMLIVTLDLEGKTRIDGNQLSSTALEAAVKGYLAAYPQGLVVLNAEDASVSYQQVVNNLENLRKIAGDRVAIATSKS
jgi:biopolymer transport protein ExbD